MAAANWLSGLYAGAHTAEGAARDARGQAETSWEGPAQQEFDEAIDGVPADFKQLADRAYDCEWALRGFAESLDKAVELMSEALGHAKDGQLRVDGPFIIAPTQPAGIAALPTKKCTPQDAQVAARHYQGDVAALHAAQADYNAKVQVYNTCKALVHDARRIEGRAHESLRARMTAEGDDGIDLLQVAITSTSYALSYVGSGENPRRAALNMAARWEEQSRFLTNWANGTATAMSDVQQRARDMAESKANRASQYRQRAAEFDKWVRFVPEKARRVITTYPGQGALDDVAQRASTLPASARGMLRAAPYVGSGLVLANELRGAVKGEQSWGKAAADTAGTVAGGALGAALATGGAAAMYGAPLGPLGSAITGVLGGAVGAIGGQAVVDVFVPE